MAWWESKIGRIVADKADARVQRLVVDYIVDSGWNKVKSIKDEQIKALTQEQCGMIDVDLWKGCLYASREIVTTCDKTEFYEYIRDCVL